MAYTLCNTYGQPQTLRLIVPDVNGAPQVRDAFRPHWWVCDPCNPSPRRYEITYHADQTTPTGMAWYEVVLEGDTERDIAVKLDHYQRVIAARGAMDDAAREYRRLTGCGWSATPPH